MEVLKYDIPEGDVSGWRDVTLGVFEMRHDMPFPLKARVFTILIASGVPATSDTLSASGGREFVIATVPLEPLPKGVGGSKFGVGTANVVHGAYVAVERVCEMEGGEIVWDMATASDAKGSLPMGLQKLGVSGAVTKDVGLFMGWVAKKRATAS